MTDSISALIAEARDLEYRRLIVGQDDDIRHVVHGLADALESLSVPAATDDDREALEVVIQGEDERWDGSNSSEDFSTRVATAVLAAGFRRPSPLTREALATWLGQYRAQVTEHPIWVADWDAADDFLSRFALPVPAEVEWAVRWTGTEGEPVTDLGADESDVRALVQEQEGFAVAVKRAVGPWVPVKGAEQ